MCDELFAAHRDLLPLLSPDEVTVMRAVPFPRLRWLAGSAVVAATAALLPLGAGSPGSGRPGGSGCGRQRPHPAAGAPGGAADCRAGAGRRGGQRGGTALVAGAAAARDKAAQLRGRLYLADLPGQRDALRDRVGLDRDPVRGPALPARAAGHRTAAAGHRDRGRGGGDPAGHVHLQGHPPLGQPAGQRAGPRLPAAAGHRRRRSSTAPRSTSDRVQRRVLPGRARRTTTRPTASRR